MKTTTFSGLCSTMLLLAACATEPIQRAPATQESPNRHSAPAAEPEDTGRSETARLQARERQIARLRTQAQALHEEGEDNTSLLEQAREQLSDLRPRRTERGLVLTLGEVLFAFDSARIQAHGERPLSRLALYLETHPKHHVRIEGHTDAVGAADYNRHLSARRAEAVRGALKARGIDADRLEAKGLGADYPVASNRTEEGQAQNRRVEIIVVSDRMAQAQAQPTGMQPSPASTRAEILVAGQCAPCPPAGGQDELKSALDR